MATQIAVDVFDGAERAILMAALDAIDKHREETWANNAVPVSGPTQEESTVIETESGKTVVVTTEPGGYVTVAPATPEPTTPEPAPEVGEEELLAKLRAFVRVKQMPAATALLQEFGVSRVAQLDPEQRAAFVARLVV